MMELKNNEHATETYNEATAYEQIVDSGMVFLTILFVSMTSLYPKLPWIFDVP